ncbi:MAG TPA: PAS domain-containing protein, partial [Vicinamibacterales bacterium]|nr:PAS domain-containing protein [Vicinamibacterales bacterium]
MTRESPRRPGRPRAGKPRTQPAKFAEANEKLRREVSARNEIEKRLRQSERELAVIIDSIPALAWSGGPDGRTDFVNQRWLNYTGLSVEQSRGHGWMTAIHPDDVQAVSDYCQSRPTSGTAAEREVRIHRFDGAYRWFLFRTDPLRDESGDVVKCYSTFTDIDDRKRLE